MVSSTYVTEGLNLLLYMALGAVLFLGVGCVGVIFLGRIGDIIEYIAFTDHQYRIPNRVACDRYIQRFSDKTLPAEFGCLLFQATNTAEINRSLGRKEGDEVLAYFAAILKELFGGEDAFVGYNGSGQFMAFVQRENSDDQKTAIENMNIILDEYMKEKKAAFKYSVGRAVSSEDDIYRIRGLISAASKRKEQYDIGSAQ